LIDLQSGRISRQQKAMQSVVRDGEETFVIADSTCGTAVQ